MLNKILFTFLFLLFANFFAFSQEGKFEILTVGNIKVHYSLADSITARKVGTHLLVNYPKINYAMGNSQIDTVSLWIPFDQKDWDLLTGGKIPEWSGGIADYGKNRIVLQSPRKAGYTQEIHKVALHELAHILLNNAVAKAGYLVPRWFNEGTAMYFAKELSFEHAVAVSQASLLDSLVSLSEIDKVMSFNSPKATLAYAQSVMAINFLVKNYKKEAIGNILGNFRNSKNFNDAMISSIGKGVWQFEQEWRTHIRTQYFWYFLLGFESYVWAFIIPVIFILAFFRKKKKRKQLEAKWRMQEILKLNES